ncbi:MAG: precorrin-6A/cobalt-precorrin-6A reductase [Alistipes senegalensis]|nr:precorrin-6A/cobalt-precorrin-6A reductase [Alistipes senegalensis]
MYKICVFGGTTEGRELVEFLNAQPCEVTACVATEYGQALLPEAERLTVSARRLPADEIKALLTDRQFDLVIDATHPYAASITKSIARACAETGVERWRLLRGASDAPEDAVFVESTEKAIEFLDQTEGNILLTTGSKELKAYSQIKDFAERVYARVLPLEDSLVLCREAQIPILFSHASTPPALPGMSIPASSGRPGVVMSSGSRSSGRVAGMCFDSGVRR